MPPAFSFLDYLAAARRRLRRWSAPSAPGIRLPAAVVLLALLAPGCSHGLRTPAVSPPPPSSPAPEAQHAPAEPSPETGEYVIQVESQPTGATVVVDGVPVGRTPYRLRVTGTAHGFLRQNLSVRVRFLAEDPSSQSHSVEAKLTPRDKIPRRLRFTPTGSRRVMP